MRRLNGTWRKRLGIDELKPSSRLGLSLRCFFENFAFCGCSLLIPLRWGRDGGGSGPVQLECAVCKMCTYSTYVLYVYRKGKKAFKQSAMKS
jgi:hypothetical protein